MRSLCSFSWVCSEIITDINALFWLKFVEVRRHGDLLGDGNRSRSEWRSAVKLTANAPPLPRDPAVITNCWVLLSGEYIRFSFIISQDNYSWFGLRSSGEPLRRFLNEAFGLLATRSDSQDLMEFFNKRSPSLTN